MIHVKDYHLFCESIDDVIDNMTSDLDSSVVDKFNDDIEKLKEEIETKKRRIRKNVIKS